MARSIEDLITDGALIYALSQLSRNRAPSEIRAALRQRYLGQPEADLDYILELAAEEVAARSKLYSEPDTTPISIRDVPFIPGTRAGVLELDVKFNAAGREGRAGKSGFVRIGMDQTDRIAAFLLGMPAPGKVQAPRLLELLQTLRELGPSQMRDVIYRLGYRGNEAKDILRQFEARGGPDIYPTRREIERFIPQLPTDEPERIVFPPNWETPKLKKMVDLQILFLGRGA